MFLTSPEIEPGTAATGSAPGSDAAGRPRIPGSGGWELSAPRGRSADDVPMRRAYVLGWGIDRLLAPEASTCGFEDGCDGHTTGFGSPSAPRSLSAARATTLGRLELHNGHTS